MFEQQAAHIAYIIDEPYGPGFYAFEDLVAAWRDKGHMDGMILDE